MVRHGRRFLAPTTMAGVLALVPGAAFAAEGMPQLNFANPLTTMQAVWLLVIFFVLYLLLKAWGLPQVARVLETRAQTIGSDLDAAQSAKQRADAAVAEMQQATARARAEALARLTEESARAKAEATARVAAETQAAEARIAEAEQRIAAARDAAMGALRRVATETAENVVVRLLGTQPDPALVQGAVDRVLAAHS